MNNNTVEGGDPHLDEQVVDRISAATDAENQAAAGAPTNDADGRVEGVAAHGGTQHLWNVAGGAEPYDLSQDDPVAGLHPVVQRWFRRQFPEGPTEPQKGGWHHIAARRNTLIAAPTGSGKTLSAFLVCIDQLARRFDAGEDLAGSCQIVYVSPLKALAVDIEHNLSGPLQALSDTAAEMGVAFPRLSAAVRTGDTSPAERQAMVSSPPNFLITTPESLYLMVTGARSRAVFANADTVIVDEIHALARDKRGSHLALTLERLAHIAKAEPMRIGLSATQRPIETVAELLVGARTRPDGAVDCEVVDVGHRRELALSIELPDSDLESVMSAEQMSDILDDVAEQVRTRRTTLVFVNTRRMAERVAHLLGERLGDEVVAAHHGSLSKDRRARVESRLRAGDLQALVATASLELGIDVGPVELVCQIGSPRAIATFLQRVGRSGHSRHGIPVGRMYPTTRDELVEAVAMFAAIERGVLDAVIPPEAPLDILAQQVIAESSAQDWDEDELFQLIRRSAPFRRLARDRYEEVLSLVAGGVQTGQGKKGAYVHRDQVNSVLRARRGARLAAVTSGGAIPELGDWRVITDHEEAHVGTVGEDWAIESMPGDVFLLGTTSWRITKIDNGTVRVVDAAGAPPTIPFWFGEAPARTAELSQEISVLRQRLADFFALDDLDGARAYLRCIPGVSKAAASLVVAYLHTGFTSLQAMPTHDRIVFERFFDEAGGMQLVVHAPYGGRINRGLGLALRKRFCKSFDFELQAAANDDAVILSLGPQHSFPLEDVSRFLASRTVGEVLTQALLLSPMWGARWRWNLNRALVVLRWRGGKRNPPQIQRMQSDDMMAAVFPRLAACQENTTGPIDLPDHPLVRQTLDDCLHEAMDVDGLADVVRGIETRTIECVFRDTTEPSVLGHEILNGRPFTFLDEAPLEERRTRSVSMQRGLPVEPRDLARLDVDVIDQVVAECRPDVGTPDELHDLLMSAIALAPNPRWARLADALIDGGRAVEAHFSGSSWWVAAERWADVASIWGDVVVSRSRVADRWMHRSPATNPDEVIDACVRTFLGMSGPVTFGELERATGLDAYKVQLAVLRLENEGSAMRGQFDTRKAADVQAVEPGPAGQSADISPGHESIADQMVVADQVCAKHILVRVHKGTTASLRSRITAVSPQNYMRFLLRWQGVTADTRRQGRRGLAAIIEQLQGFESAAGAWERSILPARLETYQSRWLDELCLGGEVVWGRLAPRAETADAPRKSTATPSRATPLTFCLRSDAAWLRTAVGGAEGNPWPEVGPGREIVEVLSERGALFAPEIGTLTGRLPAEVEEGLWDGVSRGLLTADSFQAVRSLLSARQRLNRRNRRSRRRGLRQGVHGMNPAEGRWTLMTSPAVVDEPDELAEAIAEQLLARWGVITKQVLVRESCAVPWREVWWALRRLEARGVIRGGRFVSGFSGEQFALPEAVDRLRRTAKEPLTGEAVILCATDPLNLVGSVVGEVRIAAVRTNIVKYVDGMPSVADQAGTELDHAGGQL